MAPPTHQAILRLYASTLRAARSFSSYNFRNYFVQRTKDVFREIQNEKDPNRVGALYAKAVQDRAIVQRSAAVNQFYGGWRLVVENQKPTRSRAGS